MIEKTPKLKPITAFCIIKKKSRKIRAYDIFDTDDVIVGVDEELIKVIVTPIKEIKNPKGKEK